MKKIVFTAISICLFSLQVWPQIPNAGFENWIPAGNCMNPVGWHSPNELTDTLGVYFPITRSTDRIAGRYSVRIESNPTQTSPLDWGVLMTENFDTIPGPFFPITGHPTSLDGYYKYLPQNNDTLYIHIHLYRLGTEVAMGMLVSDVVVSTWTPFTIPISAYASADSGRITMSSFYLDKGKNPKSRGNSVLFIDSLSLGSMFVAARPPSAVSIPFAVAVTGGDVVSYMLPGDAFVSIRVFDVRGRFIGATVNGRQAAGRYSLPLQADRLSSGVYLLGFDAGGSEVRKIFTVLH